MLDLMDQTRSLAAVLDDEPQYRKAPARLLKTHGFEVVTFGNREQFLKACAARRPRSGPRLHKRIINQ